MHFCKIWPCYSATHELQASLWKATLFSLRPVEIIITTVRSQLNALQLLQHNMSALQVMQQSNMAMASNSMSYGRHAPQQFSRSFQLSPPKPVVNRSMASVQNMRASSSQQMAPQSFGQQYFTHVEVKDYIYWLKCQDLLFVAVMHVAQLGNAEESTEMDGSVCLCSQGFK